MNTKERLERIKEIEDQYQRVVLRIGDISITDKWSWVDYINTKIDNFLIGAIEFKGRDVLEARLNQEAIKFKSLIGRLNRKGKHEKQEYFKEKTIRDWERVSRREDQPERAIEGRALKLKEAAESSKVRLPKD